MKRNLESAQRAALRLPVRDARAGRLVSLCGDVQPMPGLSASPAAVDVDIDEPGGTLGLV